MHSSFSLCCLCRAASSDITISNQFHALVFQPLPDAGITEHGNLFGAVDSKRAVI